MMWIAVFVGFAIRSGSGTGHGYGDGQEMKQMSDSVYSFQKDIAPLLKENCTPCHYPGGKVFKKLPFEDYKTVRMLGKKLNTRFQKKEEQALVNQWVDGGSKK